MGSIINASIYIERNMPNTSKVFEYTGSGQHVPKDVISVRFHPSVVEIDIMAFHCCRSLREVVLNEGPKKISNHAFAGCGSLESITIPSSVEELDSAAFYKCSSLKEVVLKEGLKKIGSAFSSCETLKSITLPSTVTVIGERAFSDCMNLSEVVLNEGLEKIKWKAFEGCNSLQSITLPSSVVEIGRVAFCECINLSEVVCIEGLPKVEYNTFASCPALERIAFPDISTRLEDIIRAGQADVQNKIQQCINQGDIEWRRGNTVCIPAEVTRRKAGWGLVQQHLRQIVNWIKYYEMKEATTIFELALWKTKMDQQVEEDDERDCKKVKMDQAEDDTDRHDRNAYRVEVPGPVKDSIMKYLDL